MIPNTASRTVALSLRLGAKGPLVAIDVIMVAKSLDFARERTPKDNG